MSLFKKDWRRVEAYIGTRTGAQIRSHAQKFFSKVEKEVGGGGEQGGAPVSEEVIIEGYITERARVLMQ
jgi:hypothetical protein